jgi:quinol monooxygenase YgiN
MEIIVSGTLHVAPDERGIYISDRLAIIAHARRAPGCLDFSLSPDPLDDGRINVYERWRSREDLGAYRAGDGPELDDRIALVGAAVELHEISSSGAP